MLCLCCTVFMFLFKRKTAYDLRISDWSSDVCSSDLLRERRDQSRLWRRERVRPRARRADEAQRLVEHIEHRRHDERAEDHADDQRDLLLPRRRADELAGLEVLEIVVRDRRDTEHKPGDDQHIGDHPADLPFPAATTETTGRASVGARGWQAG